MEKANESEELDQNQMTVEEDNTGQWMDEALPVLDDLIEELQPKPSKKRGRRKKRKRRKSSKEDADAKEVSSSKMPSVKLMPNVFFGVRVRSQVIKRNVVKLQRQILQHNENYVSLLEPVEKSHVTLFVGHLPWKADYNRIKLSEEGEQHDASDQQLSRISRLVQQYCQDKLTPAYPSGMKLKFQGVGSFSNGKVIFVKPDLTSTLSLTSIVTDLHSLVNPEMEISQEGATYHPHLTTFKGKRGNKSGPKSIVEEAYRDMVDADFGEESVFSLQLLSMTEPKDKDGYYHVLA